MTERSPDRSRARNRRWKEALEPVIEPERTALPEAAANPTGAAGVETAADTYTVSAPRVDASSNADDLGLNVDELMADARRRLIQAEKIQGNRN